MKRKKKFILLTLTSMCLFLFACTDKANTNSTGSTSVTGTTSTTGATSTTGTTSTTGITSATGTTGATEQKSASISDIVTTSSTTKADKTQDLIAETSRLMGALDYIDCIGGGNIPKDENDIKEVGGRKYAKVKAQFSNTSDLKEYLQENLSDSLIKNRYSGIVGGQQPYYIDIDGALYGYMTAKGCGYTWIKNNDKLDISITEKSDNSFTAITKFDNYGGEDEMKLNIVFTDGLWKIKSISYDGMTY